MAAVAKRQGIKDQTIYSWSKNFCASQTDGARRLKRLESENAQLKKRMADVSLCNTILKNDASGETLHHRIFVDQTCATLAGSWHRACRVVTYCRATQLGRPKLRLDEAALTLDLIAWRHKSEIAVID